MQTQVQKAYHVGLDRLGPKGRLARVFDIYDSIRGIVAHRILKERPGLNPRDLAFHVAKRMHAHDPMVLKLLDRCRP